MAIHISDAVRDDMLDAITAAVDAGTGAGYIEVRSGTQPADADTTATGTVLAEFTLADPSFAASSNGVITLDADPDISATAAATGTASWARCYDSNDVAIFDGSVGTSGTDFIITSTSITSGQTVNLTAGTLTLAP